jgi:hypothetical protein
MCFKIVTTDDLLEACIHDTDKYTRLKGQYAKYRVRDILFLYAVAFAMIVNSVAIVFAMTTAQCDSSGKTQFNDVIRNECLFLSSFSIIVLAMRLWFFRAYLQYPVIATWGQHDLSTKEVVMNVFYFLFGLACLATYVVMFYELITENYIGAIIVTCIVCCLAMWTSLWYKMIIMQNIKRALKTYTNVPVASVVRTDNNI